MLLLKVENFWEMPSFNQQKLLFIVLITINIISLSISLLEQYYKYRLLIYIVNTSLSLLIALILSHKFQSKRIFRGTASILSVGIFFVYTYTMFGISIPGTITIVGFFLIVTLTIFFQILFFYLICESIKLKIIGLFIILMVGLYLILFKQFKTNELHWYLCFNAILLVNSIYSFVSFYKSAKNVKWRETQGFSIRS